MVLVVLYTGIPPQSMVFYMVYSLTKFATRTAGALRRLLVVPYHCPYDVLTISLAFPYHSLTKFATRCEGHCCILLQYHCHGSGGPWSWPSPWPGFLIESGYRKGHVLSVFYGSRCFVYGNTPAIYGICKVYSLYQLIHFVLHVVVMSSRLLQSP